MIPRPAALATALATATAQDWRWMETHDGAQYATLALPTITITIAAPPSASPEDVVVQARAALSAPEVKP
jgi:hypothetical protein